MKTVYNIVAVTTVMAMLVTALLLIGCESAPGGSDLKPVNDFYLSGLLSVDENNGTAQVIVRFSKNDVPISDATVQLDTIATTFQSNVLAFDSVYFVAVNPETDWPTGVQKLRFSYSNGFQDSLTTAVGDTFSITSIFPANRIWRTVDGPVKLEWSGTPDIDGYIITTVKANQAYTGKGFSAYAVEMATIGTIPPDAFLNPVGNEPDTGLYNIYIYAYSGSPDKALADKILPVPLPTQLPDNISGNNLSGRFGTIVVTLTDTLRVVVQ